MPDLPRILHAIDAGDPRAAQELLPLVYEELRKLAAQRLAHEKPGQTLQATALVDHRGHFFAAAAEAMRRILVERARRQGRVRHGGLRKRVELNDGCSLIDAPPLDDLLSLDEALSKLAALDPKRAELVKLRFFAGLSMPEAAEVLGVSLATAERYWTFARTWLFAALSKGDV